MSLPGIVRREVEEAMFGAGDPRTLTRVTPVGGGCINNGARIETSDGRALFLKWNVRAPLDMFEAEADGLAALRAPGALAVPEPLAWGGGVEGPAWLVMQHVAHGPGGRDADERLGQALAALHEAADVADPPNGVDVADPPNGEDAVTPRFGWRRDNWIGSLPQANERTDSWASFWRDRRIAPQLDMARDRGRVGDGMFDRLLDAIAPALEGVTAPCLLHGDLWSGNVFTSSAGEPVVIDPAVYRGDGEVDLAMSELFGGFGARFYDAYREARGVGAAYDSHRRALYQLYYLLVHVNLFGPSYEAGARTAAGRVVAAVG